MAGLSRKYKKDFKQKSYNNPRLVKEKVQRQKKLKKVLLYFALGIILGLLIVVFFSPVFQIKEVDIVGINKISSEKFKTIVDDYRFERKFFIFSRNNLLLFSKKALKNKIGESYLLDTVKIDKDFRSRLVIEVIEKDAKIIWITNNKCFHLDETGQAIESCEGGELNNFIKIYDDLNVDVNIGQYAVDKEILGYLLRCNELLGMQITADVYHINHDGPYSIRIETNESYDILINFELSCDAQFKRFFALIKGDEVSKKIETIQYFDLRFGEKIYYK